jgi:fatty acid desaturase
MNYKLSSDQTLEENNILFYSRLLCNIAAILLSLLIFFGLIWVVSIYVGSIFLPTVLSIMITIPVSVQIAIYTSSLIDIIESMENLRQANE